MTSEIEKIRGDLQHLEPNEWAGLMTFIDRLQQRYGDDLRCVKLFGSKARGDFDDESDLDILIILRMDPDKFRCYWNEIVDMAWQVEWTHGLVTSLIIKDESEYERFTDSNLLLSRNIEHDGIVLWIRQPN